MNAEREQIDWKCDVSLQVCFPVHSFELPETEPDSAFIRIYPWQESSFTLPIITCEPL